MYMYIYNIVHLYNYMYNERMFYVYSSPSFLYTIHVHVSHQISSVQSIYIHVHTNTDTHVHMQCIIYNTLL